MSTPTVLITGASRGLGAATARAVARMGARVAITARSRQALEAVAEEIGASGGEVAVIPGDVSDADDRQEMLAAARAAFGELDALVNNAGVLDPIAPLGGASAAAWEYNLRVNLLAPVHLTRLALPSLLTRSGRVINVSSGAAVKVIEGWSAYCTAKAGLNHFTRCLAEEHPEITAISFRPGVVDTAMQARIRQEGDEGMPDEVHERYVRYHEEGELLPPERPARSLAALALHAPPVWSGEFLAWDADRVLALVEQVDPAT